jgi:hypothetical protein
VGTVPEETEVVTYPLESDVAEVGVNVIPPGALEGIRLKSTTTPSLPLLFSSTTLNFTREFLGSVAAPAVEVPMIDGVAEMNCILLVAGVETVINALAVAPLVMDATIVSVPEHPLSLYVVAAMPVLVLLVTGLVIVALPLTTQEEVNDTEIGTVAAEPPINTGTLTLLVP